MPHEAEPARALRTAVAAPVVFACAASAGIHAGLVPEHLREEPRLGVAFMIASVVLVATGTIVAWRPDRLVAHVASLVLGGLIISYIASRTTGIPVLAPDSEAVDAVGIAAVLIELLGMTCALRLAHPIGHRQRRPFLEEVSR
jgi:Na+/pantothenate symporter